MTIEEINKLIKEKRSNLTEKERSIWIDGWIDGYLEAIGDYIKYSIAHEKGEENDK